MPLWWTRMITRSKRNVETKIKSRLWTASPLLRRVADNLSCLTCQAGLQNSSIRPSSEWLLGNAPCSQESSVVSSWESWKNYKNLPTRHPWTFKVKTRNSRCSRLQTNPRSGEMRQKVRSTTQMMSTDKLQLKSISILNKMKFCITII